MAKEKGFTLIEILIAVAVLAIALIAVTRNTTLAAKETGYLQQRTIAHWVAMDVMAQTQTGLIAPPPTGSSRSGNETMLNQQWPWKIKTAPTAKTRIIKTQVTVYNPTNNRQMDSVSSYILLPKRL